MDLPEGMQTWIYPSPTRTCEKVSTHPFDEAIGEDFVIHSSGQQVQGEMRHSMWSVTTPDPGNVQAVN